MIRKCNFAGVASSLKYLQGNYRLRGNAKDFEVGKEKIRASRGSMPLHLSLMAKSRKPLGKDVSVCRGSGGLDTLSGCRGRKDRGVPGHSKLQRSLRHPRRKGCLFPLAPNASFMQLWFPLLWVWFARLAATWATYSIKAGRSALCLTS